MKVSSARDIWAKDLQNVTGAILSALLPRRNLSYTMWSSFSEGIFGTAATRSRNIAVNAEVINEQVLGVS